MRKYVIADKRTFDISWTDLPNSTDYTVDGFWGGSDIELFYRNNFGSFIMTITHGDGTTEAVNVMFASYSSSIKKRGLYDFWDVTVSLEEV